MLLGPLLRTCVSSVLQNVSIVGYDRAMVAQFDIGDTTRRPGKGITTMAKKLFQGVLLSSFLCACSVPLEDRNSETFVPGGNERRLISPLTAAQYQGQLRYGTWANTQETLHAWRGNRALVLTPQLLSSSEASAYVGFMDTCVELYQRFANRSWPILELTGFPGLATVAVVQETCGAGCGAGGRAEIQVTEFEDAVARVGSVQDAMAWQVGFYELGRQGSSRSTPTFPFFNALDITASHDVVASAFPEFVATECLRSFGYSLNDIYESYLNRGYQRVPGAAEYRRRFLASNLSFNESQRADQPDLMRNWVLTSMLTYLRLEFGASFMARFLQELSFLSAASVEQVEANLLQAATEAGGTVAQAYLRNEWRVGGLQAPDRPASVDVQSDYCFGLNTVNWTAVAGATRYELQGAPSASFSGARLLYSGSSRLRIIDVSRTTYVRARACNAQGCSDYRRAARPARYFSGCY